MERDRLLDFSDGFLKGLGADNKRNLPLVPTGPTIVPSIVTTNEKLATLHFYKASVYR